MFLLVSVGLLLQLLETSFFSMTIITIPMLRESEDAFIFLEEVFKNFRSLHCCQKLLLQTYVLT